MRPKPRSNIAQVEGSGTVGAVDGSARNMSAFSSTPPPLKARDVKFRSSNISTGGNGLAPPPSTKLASDKASRTDMPSSSVISGPTSGPSSALNKSRFWNTRSPNGMPGECASRSLSEKVTLSVAVATSPPKTPEAVSTGSSRSAVSGPGVPDAGRYLILGSGASKIIEKPVGPGMPISSKPDGAKSESKFSSRLNEMLPGAGSPPHATCDHVTNSPGTNVVARAQSGATVSAVRAAKVLTRRMISLLLGARSTAELAGDRAYVPVFIYPSYQTRR